MRFDDQPPAGFILVATLWVLAALAVMAAYIDRIATTNVEQAVMTRKSIELQLRQLSTEATVIYLLATNRMNHRGLLLEDEQRFADSVPDGELPNSGDGELTVTGQAYQGFGEVVFSLQDESGLVSVNSPRFPILAAMLKKLGAASADVAMVITGLGVITRDGLVPHALEKWAGRDARLV